MAKRRHRRNGDATAYVGGLVKDFIEQQQAEIRDRRIEIQQAEKALRDWDVDSLLLLRIISEGLAYDLEEELKGGT